MAISPKELAADDATSGCSLREYSAGWRKEVGVAAVLVFELCNPELRFRNSERAAHHASAAPQPRLHKNRMHGKKLSGLAFLSYDDDRNNIAQQDQDRCEQTVF